MDAPVRYAHLPAAGYAAGPAAEATSWAEGAGDRARAPGIGRAIALSLGDAGADVVVNYVSGEDKAPSPGRGDPRQGHHEPSQCAPTCRMKSQVRDMFGAMIKELRHDRHPGQQRRSAAGRPVPRADAGAMEQGDGREPHRAVPVRARGSARVHAPRGERPDVSCSAGKILCVSSVHEVIPVGGPRELRGLQRRRDADDEEPGAGSGAVSDPRQLHLSRRDPHADQHGSLGHARGLQRADEADSLQAHR